LNNAQCSTLNAQRNRDRARAALSIGHCALGID
jgi:hypothetical protein